MSSNGIHNNSDVVTPNDEKSIAFVQGLVARGEAIAAPSDGALPPNVTHIIVGRTQAGYPIVKRIRFSVI